MTFGKQYANLREQLGCSRPQMFKTFGFPVRTQECWEKEERIPPPYVCGLIIEKLETQLNNN